MAKKRSDKAKKALAEKETDDIEPSTEEIFVLKVWKLMDGNPLLKKMPKPSQDYLEGFIKELPPLKTLNAIEVREHILNLAAMSYIRDLLWSDLSIAIEEHPKNWKDYFDDKHIRLLKDVIKEEEKFMPKIFKDGGVSGEIVQRGKMIVKTLRERTIEFERDDQGGDIIEGKVADEEDTG